MHQTLEELDERRCEILAEIIELGDFRSGSITAISGRCGKPNCHCHKPGGTLHGPNYRLTRKVNGKTVSETFGTPAALRKAEREIATFHRFRTLSRELLEVNEKICRAVPVDNAPAPKEVKRSKRSGAARRAK